MQGRLREDTTVSVELTEGSTEAGEILALVRETDQAARRLLTRAAHLERLAGRCRTDGIERADLDSHAEELRAAAELLLVEVCALSRRATRRDSSAGRSQMSHNDEERGLNASPSSYP